MSVLRCRINVERNAVTLVGSEVIIGTPKTHEQRIGDGSTGAAGARERGNVA